MKNKLSINEQAQEILKVLSTFTSVDTMDYIEEDDEHIIYTPFCIISYEEMGCWLLSFDLEFMCEPMDCVVFACLMQDLINLGIDVEIAESYYTVFHNGEYLGEVWETDIYKIIQLSEVPVDYEEAKQLAMDVMILRTNQKLN